MEKKSNQYHWLPASIHYQPTKELLQKVEKKLSQDKQISKEKKQNYVRVVRQMNYTMGKTVGRWPHEVDKLIDNLKSILQEFQNTLISIAKGSSFFCGSGASPKQLENIFSRLVGYERIFQVIRPFQDKQVRDDILATYQEQKENMNSSRSKRSAPKKDLAPPPPTESVIETTLNSEKVVEKCKNCQLLLAVSLCPNGYIAKKLVKELPDTEWIYGILYEEGTVVDKDIDKAIRFYEAARKKKNYQATYRLGSLNERGLYGKPYDYLKMWEEASEHGHLEALTDMGYLYENGLEDEDTGRTILEPNADKALSYYSKAASKHFPRAMNNLATFYFGNEKYRDERKCLRYLEDAAEAEYVKALHNLGVINYEGKLVPYDEEKAKNLIRRAAEKGDIEGRIMYTQLLLNDANSCSFDQLADLNKFCREIIAKDEENSEAYYFLGIMLQEGYGVNKQPKTAFLYYTIAASMHNDSALMKLGECYRNGFGVEQDLREAIRCYDKASKGNKEALVCLGQVYEKGGQDLNPNYQKAWDYYYEACNLGVPQAYSHVANMYRYGRHVKKNEAKAEEYFQKARNFQRQSNTRKLGASSSDLIQSSYYRRR